MRYSRTLPGQPYLASTAVLLSEFVKLTISVIVYIWTRYRDSPDKRFSLFLVFGWLQQVFGSGSDAWKLSIPAVLYTIQNNLQYVAVTL